METAQRPVLISQLAIMSWGEVNEYVLLRIYSLLSTGDLASAGKVCRRWRGISRWSHASVDITLDIASTLLFCILPLQGRAAVEEDRGEELLRRGRGLGRGQPLPGHNLLVQGGGGCEAGCCQQSRDTDYLTLHLNNCPHLTATARIPPPPASTGG